MLLVVVLLSCDMNVPRCFPCPLFSIPITSVCFPEEKNVIQRVIELIEAIEITGIMLNGYSNHCTNAEASRLARHLEHSSEVPEV